LVEDETYDEKDLVEEFTLVGKTNGGQRRVGPQEKAENVVKMFACNICTSNFQSLRMLEEHKKNHVAKFECNKCSETFDTNACFNEHMKKELIGLCFPSKLRL
jgi:predicted SprT family Zn-dependent metalloprotease